MHFLLVKLLGPVVSLGSVAGVVVPVSERVFEGMADQAWERVELQWEEHLGKDAKLKLFPIVPKEEDFAEHPAVIKLSKKHDAEVGLDRVWQMKFKGVEYSDDYVSSLNDDSILKCVEGREFQSRQEVAEFFLPLLSEYEDDVRGLEQALNQGLKMQACILAPPTIANYWGGKMQNLNFKIIRWTVYFHSVAELHLAVGQSKEAFEALERSRQLVDLLGQQEAMLGMLCMIACEAGNEQVLLEGLYAHAWSKDQLEQIKKWAGDREWKEVYYRALVSEYYYVETIVSILQKSGYDKVEKELGYDAVGIWIDRDERSLLGRVIESYFSKVSPEGLLMYQAACMQEAMLKVLHDMKRNEGERSIADHRKTMARELPDTPMHSLSESWHRLIAKQEVASIKASTRNKMLQVAVALEFYHREYHEYPEDLKLLVPKYLNEVPRDLFSNGTFQYQLDEEGLPKLSSKGPLRSDRVSLDEGDKDTHEPIKFSWARKVSD